MSHVGGNDAIKNPDDEIQKEMSQVQEEEGNGLEPVLKKQVRHFVVWHVNQTRILDGKMIPF